MSGAEFEGKLMINAFKMKQRKTTSKGSAAKNHRRQAVAMVAECGGHLSCHCMQHLG